MLINLRFAGPKPEYYEPRIVTTTKPNRHAGERLAKRDSQRSDGVHPRSQASPDAMRRLRPPACTMLEILYDSGPCLVVNKRAGLLTQAPAGIDSLEQQVKAFY